MTQNYKITKASPQDAFLLTRIAKSAKQYWGYPDEWMALWQDDLTIKPAHFRNIQFWKITTNEEIAGFTSISEEEGVFEIDHCFVSPDHMGKGLGSKLIEHVLSLPEYLNRPFKVLADPHAVNFYEKFGFKTVSQIPSKPEGRTLPLMEMINVASYLRPDA